MKTLGIESSCDETAVAIVDGANILASVVASQHSIHAKYGGVVPELASRRHVEVIVPLLKEAFAISGLGLSDIDGLAVTRAPGLIGALLVGLSTAKAIARVLGVPLIGVNHLEGHLNAIHLSEKDVPYPHIGLVVSGGHTSLYLVEDFGSYKLLGATRDDAAGEAFDKVARLLGLGYPGGPVIDKMTAGIDPPTVEFKQPKFRNLAEFDFSFSGIKTSVMFHYKKLCDKGACLDEEVLNLVAGFQSAVVDSLTKHIIRAAEKFKCRNAVVSGGVAANNALRRRLAELCPEHGINVLIPPIKLCTDNAAMIAYVGGRYIEMGKRDNLDLNAKAVEEIGI